ncbi:MAG: hypothetical protein O3B84_05885 [Chloroflexi bacterium]|nr:hypothetical protein [Chloroflexota bacterium]
MASIKRILCLANTRKNRGQSIAGIEIGGVGGPSWIRPVADRLTDELTTSECQYEDGGDPRVFDVMDVPVLGPRPTEYQTENWLHDPAQRWTKAGEVQIFDLERYAEKRGALWVNATQTRDGQNDLVPSMQGAVGKGISIRLIRATDVVVVVRADQRGSSQRVQARFVFDGVEYAMAVSDPVAERDYRVKGEGEYAVEDGYLTINLGTPFADGDRNRHKTVAALIPLP